MDGQQNIPQVAVDHQPNFVIQFEDNLVSAEAVLLTPKPLIPGFDESYIN